MSERKDFGIYTDELERIAKALESIAESMAKLANPPVLLASGVAGGIGDLRLKDCIDAMRQRKAA